MNRSWQRRMAAVAFVPILLAFVAVQASAEPPCPIEGALGGSGIRVEAPGNDAAGLDQAAAQTIAAKNVPSARAGEAALSRVTDDAQPNMRGRLVWTVRMEDARRVGSVGPAPGGEPGATVCTAAFVDAKSGDFLFGVQYGTTP